MTTRTVVRVLEGQTVVKGVGSYYIFMLGKKEYYPIFTQVVYHSFLI